MSSKDRGTVWLGGVNWPAVRKSVARGVAAGEEAFELEPESERPVMVGEYVLEDEDNGLGGNNVLPSPGREPGVARFNGFINCTRCALAIFAMDSALLMELIGRSLYIDILSSLSVTSPSLKGLEPDFSTIELDPLDLSEGVALDDGEDPS